MNNSELLAELGIDQQLTKLKYVKSSERENLILSLQIERYVKNLKFTNLYLNK